MTRIFFLKLNSYTLIPMLFFRVMGRGVYFLDCAEGWRSLKMFWLFSKLGLTWMSYQETVSVRGGEVQHARSVHAERVGNTIFKSGGSSWLTKAICPDANLKTSIYERIYIAVTGPVELFFAMKSINGNSLVIEGDVWIPNTVISRHLLTEFPLVNNHCPPLWSTIELCMAIAGRISHAAKNKNVAKIRRIAAYFSRQRKAKHKKEISEQLPLTGVEVAYFPHEGVLYGPMFKKDHFYDENKDSKLNPRNILHIELDGFESVECNAYYEARQITNRDWRGIAFRKGGAYKSLLTFFYYGLNSLFDGTDLDLLMKFSAILWGVKSAESRLDTMPNLKIILVGYDILFPQTLVVACAIKNVKTVAIQERLLAAWWGTPKMFDYYYLIGQAAFDQLKSKRVGRCDYKLLGPVRMENHILASAPKLFSCYKEKYSCVVLAMSFHSENHWFSNGRAFGNNWARNIIFYDHLLKLCTDFPRVGFLLKEKNSDFLKIPFFRNMARSLVEQHNLTILSDSEWTPFSAVAAADIGFARHTSLADEMMAMGKPVIFDDFDGFPSEVYDYGDAVTAYSYFDIKSKLEDFLASPVLFNKKINPLRAKLYHCPAGGGEAVRSDVMRLLDECSTNLRT